MRKPKILIVYYSMYSHILTMAKELASAIESAGGEVILKRVAELVPDQFLDEYAKQIQQTQKDIPVADPRTDLQNIDGIIIGTPTRFGNMAAQMKNFLDQTGGDWFKGTLIGKPAGVFTSTATQHGGQETTIISSMIPLLHHGCVLVGLPYSAQEQMTISEMSGGSPYGATTITGGQGERQPSENEIKLIQAYGKHFTQIAVKLLEK